VVAPLAVGDFLAAGPVDTALLGIDRPSHPKPAAGAGNPCRVRLRLRGVGVTQAARICGNSSGLPGVVR
jgi:hypothetical protein